MKKKSKALDLELTSSSMLIETDKLGGHAYVDELAVGIFLLA